MFRFFLVLFFSISLIADDFVNVPFEKFIQYVAHISQKNIILSDNLDKDFNIFLPRYDTLDAKRSISLLKNVCAINGLVIRKRANVYLIYRPRPLVPPRRKPRVVKFRYLDSSDINATIAGYYPDINFTVLRHRVFFSATDEQYKTVAEAIATLDDSYSQTPLNLLIFSTRNGLERDIGPDLQTVFKSSNTYIKMITSQVNFSATIPDPYDFIAFVNLLAKKGYTDILSNPTINIVDGKPALLQDAINIPYKTNTVTTKDAQNVTQESIDYRDIGLKIEIDNVILSDDRAEFDITIEHQSILEKSITPTTTNKKLQTHVTLKRGEYFLIGGLISKETYTTQSHIPVIDHIPIIGPMTRHTTTSESDKTFSVVLSIPERGEHEKNSR